MAASPSSSAPELLGRLSPAARLDADRLVVSQPDRFASHHIDDLVFDAVFNDDPGLRDAARWLIWEASQALGCPSASIHELYMARGRGEFDPTQFTVPAINVRASAYLTARQAFTEALARDAGTVIFEIAKSEMAYTDQRPAEYAAVILASAIRTGWRGPVFLQGDHFQFNAGKWKEDPAKEMAGLRDLTREVGVQTGAGHGRVPLHDGTVATVKIDFDTLKRLSTVAREEYGLAGAVQHGASTLPEEAFHHFPANGTAEIHLATGFQNILYDDGGLPPELRAETMEWCRTNAAGERKGGETEDQFLYKTRKKAIGPFKRALWTLPPDAASQIAGNLRAKFGQLFDELGIAGTRGLVDRLVSPMAIHRPLPVALGGAAA